MHTVLNNNRLAVSRDRCSEWGTPAGAGWSYRPSTIGLILSGQCKQDYLSWERKAQAGVHWWDKRRKTSMRWSTGCLQKGRNCKFINLWSRWKRRETILFYIYLLPPLQYASFKKLVLKTFTDQIIVWTFLIMYRSINLKLYCGHIGL